MKIIILKLKMKIKIKNIFYNIYIDVLFKNLINKYFLKEH